MLKSQLDFVGWKTLFFVFTRFFLIFKKIQLCWSTWFSSDNVGIEEKNNHKNLPDLFTIGRLIATDYYYIEDAGARWSRKKKWKKVRRIYSNDNFYIYRRLEEIAKKAVKYSAILSKRYFCSVARYPSNPNLVKNTQFSFSSRLGLSLLLSNKIVRLCSFRSIF